MVESFKTTPIQNNLNGQAGKLVRFCTQTAQSVRDAAKAKTNPLIDREQNKTLFIHSSLMQLSSRTAKGL